MMTESPPADLTSSNLNESSAKPGQSKLVAYRQKAMLRHDGEEKKEGERSFAVMALHGPGQCDVYETMDECVGCLDGVGEQHTFEEGLSRQAAQQRQIALEHGLSEAEAAIIRLQMIDSDADRIRTAMENTLTTMDPGLDDLLVNVCGQNDSDLCDGVVMPTDTTLPTSLSGQELVESRIGKSARSLVDVAAVEDVTDENKASPTVDDSVQECVICNDTYSTVEGSTLSTSSGARKPTFCHLPCCETDEDDDKFKVCTACMLVLTVATKDGFSRVGRCPRCRAWLSILTMHSTSANMDIRKLETSGTCETCLQEKQPLICEDPSICDACFLGKEVPLTYECEECQQAQAIHSTLYRSQPTSTSFGNEMWPCNVCQKSTHWKLRFEQLPLIPAGDIPEEWGTACLELARMRVLRARQSIAKLDLPGRDVDGKRSLDEGCAIM